MFLQSRNELTGEEEWELGEWRKKSPSHEQFFQELTDPANTRARITELYQGRERVFNKLKAEFPYLADVNLSELDFSEELQASGFAEPAEGKSKVAYWGSMLPGIDGSVFSGSESKPEGLTPVGGLIRRMRKNRAFRWASNIAAAIVGLLLVLTVVVQFLPSSRPHKYTGRINAQVVGSDGIAQMIDDMNYGYQIGKADFDIGRDKEGFLVFDAKDHKRAPLDKFIRMKTPKAGEFPFRFPDKTYMWINSESVLDFPAHFSTDTIKMHFTGETYMEVPSHPETLIQIKLPDGLVETRGANINIKAYADEPFLTITVAGGSAVYRLPSKDSLPVRETLIKAGEQIRISGNRVEPVSNARVNDAIAWRREKISFHNVDLETIMHSLGRLYDKEIIYEIPLPARPFTVDLPRDIPLEQYLSALEAQGLHFKVEGDKIKVVGNGQRAGSQHTNYLNVILLWLKIV